MNKSSKSNLDDSLLEYIAKHGFGDPIPTLDRKLSADVFRQHYYDKQELRDFCRQNLIPTSGLKEDLNQRIEYFLRTGQVMAVAPPVKSSRSDSETGLSLDKIVVNYKSDPITRNFLASNIPGFTGFGALVQKQIKQRLANHETFTYGDVVEMQKAFMRDKANARATGQATKVAHDSCQLNQFSIDYSHDPAPKLHTMNEAWMLVRNSAGAKTYQRYKDRIEEIRGILDRNKASETP